MIIQRKTAESFAGSQSYSKVRREFGDITFTMDFIKKFKCNLTIDILNLNYKDYDQLKDLWSFWASPPCTTFSVASIGTHWTGGLGAYIPKTKECKIGLQILEQTIKIISEIKPKYWYIENPCGVMRKVIDRYFKKYNVDYVERKIWYCQYGDIRAKPTNIWTNNFNWKPRPCCKNYIYNSEGNIINKHCHHESARRGSKTGTQGLKDDYNRSMIPRELFIEIRESEEQTNGD